MSQLAKYGSKDQAWKAANALRKRLRNAEIMKSELTRRGGAMVLGSGVAAAAGFVMGQMETKAATEGTLGTAEDPTQLFGIPLPAVAGVVMAAVGLGTAKAMEKKAKGAGHWIAAILESGGNSLVSASVYEWAKKKGAEASA